MAENTKIEWADHTFNPWWGCQKVSPACDNCYAEALDKRIHGGKHWGRIGKERKPASEHTWKQPLKWNRAAADAGKRARVFCASMGDVFEARSELDHLRQRLWELIRATPHLDWLLLTKRPQNFWMLPWCSPSTDNPDEIWSRPWPNVWLGVTAEDQQWLERRGRILMQTPAVRRFISAEPLLGPINLWSIVRHDRPEPDWVISGGESGPNARPSDTDWFRSLRDQCNDLEIHFFFKQWGEWAGESQYPWVEEDTRINRPSHEFEDGNWSWRVGKAVAGRELDGRTHDEVPV